MSKGYNLHVYKDITVKDLKIIWFGNSTAHYLKENFRLYSKIWRRKGKLKGKLHQIKLLP